jgi:hypothetical protein
MKILYADTGLLSEAGHHANSCRAITAALRARGHQVQVLASVLIHPDLAEDLSARRHFRHMTYNWTNGDPLAGWLFSFFNGAQSLTQDLLKLGPFGPDHLIYMNSIMPAQLFGVRNFLAALPPGQRPIVVAEFGTEPGLDYVMEDGVGRYVGRDPRVDPRAALYRFAARATHASALEELHLVTFDPTSTDLYRLVLELPVETLPVPRTTRVRARRRGGARPITVGVLGHQRRDKGYALVPEIVRLLLARRDDIRFLIHCAEPRMVAAEQEHMRAIAAGEPRVMLDERPAGPELWESLLEQTDLVLCPYDPKVFRVGYSAVASEAIARAIPLVVPAQTTLARIVGEFGGPGVAFGEHSAASVAEAVDEAVDQFECLADRALAAAMQWRATMGADAMVEAMLAAAAGAATAPAEQVA